jgi:hypothetical protein
MSGLRRFARRSRVLRVARMMRTLGESAVTAAAEKRGGKALLFFVRPTRQSEKGKWQEESSFCEQATAKTPRRKEVKKLYPFAAGSPASRAPSPKSFFASFFSKKEGSSCLQPLFSTHQARRP